MRERRTVYHHQGYRMRSYTELLWARVLEAAGLFYLYEPDLVRVDDGYYLPDFWLPHVGIYLEVKGQSPTPEEIKKADAVMDRTGREVMFLIARPQADDGGLFNCGLLVRGASGWTSNISPSDLHGMVRREIGIGAWLKIKLACEEDDLDWVRPIGHLLEEFFLNRADRPDMEKVLRDVHSVVNRDRMASIPEASICEQGLKWFLDRQKFRKDQRGAA